MDWLQALILGFIQGLTEYLPVSSSGHLEIGRHLLGVEISDSLTFDIIVHIATVLSTLVILRKEVSWIFCGLFKKPQPAASVAAGSDSHWLDRFNMEQRYVLNIIISMIPIGIVGVFFKDQIDSIFENSIAIVGICLLITAALLAFSHFFHPRVGRDITPLDAFIIGLAQAVAVLPGISRSGSTIATGLLLGDSREKLAQFSFLMVIPPILGEALLDAKDLLEGGGDTLSPLVMIAGFLAAFISGCLACKIMIALVKKSKMIWFAIYCALMGGFALLYL